MPLFLPMLTSYFPPVPFRHHVPRVYFLRDPSSFFLYRVILSLFPRKDNSIPFYPNSSPDEIR